MVKISRFGVVDVFIGFGFVETLLVEVGKNVIGVLDVVGVFEPGVLVVVLVWETGNQVFLLLGSLTLPLVFLPLLIKKRSYCQLVCFALALEIVGCCVLEFVFVDGCFAIAFEFVEWCVLVFVYVFC